MVITSCLVSLAGCVGMAPTVDADEVSPPADIQTTPSIPAAPYSSEHVPESIRFTYLGLEEGLSQSTVYSIAQDSIGFMWFGTEDGLNRYDGYEFKVFRPEIDNSNSLSDRWITSLAPDGKGNLWIGTRQGGLNYYNSATGIFHHYLNDNSDPNSLASNTVQELYTDKAGQLWIGTTNGLDRFSTATGKFEHFLIVNSPDANSRVNSISSIYEDENGTFWVGSVYSGLYRFVPSTGKFFGYTNEPGNYFSLSDNSIRGIQQAEDGALWVATNNGLNLFHPATGRFTRLLHSTVDSNTISDNSIRTIFVDKAGKLWVGTETGLDCYDQLSNTFAHFHNDPTEAKSLSNNYVLSIFESNDAVIWIGTYGGALNKYFRGMDRFRYYHHNAKDPTALSGNVIFKIFIDRQNLAWISTIDGGLNRLDPSAGHVITYKHDPKNPGSLINNETWSVIKDSQDVLWVGTSTGLDRLDHGSKEFIHYNRQISDFSRTVNGLVYDIVEDKDGILWFGASNGLDKYIRETDTFIHYVHDANAPGSISSSSVVKVYIDRLGNLWVGTFANGLDRYDPKTDSFIHYQHNPNDPQSLSNDSILSVYQDRLGRLWVGTGGGGLNLLDSKTNTFTHITEKDGLPNGVIYGIEEDESGLLWLSTNKGISRFDPSAKTFLNFTESDGLQGNEFNMNAYAKDKNGYLYFGGTNGLTVFNPNTIIDSSFRPPVVLLSITENGLPLTTGNLPEQTDKVTIKWPYNSFEFSFASLSYADPKKNQYAYRLENFDTNWVNAGPSREGRYTNLPGGSYTLKIKGSNEDGKWNENGYSLHIDVIPAFWQTLWFSIIAILAVFGLAATVYRLRTQNIQTNNRELERQVRERTKEIERLFEKTKELAVVEERNRLARELHDSAKQKAFAALAQLGTASGVLPQNPQAARQHLREAEDLVYEVIEELTFLIQEMYPLALKEKGLATSLREYVFDWEARTDIEIQMQIENEKRVHLDVEQAIYRAVQEALSNVARHSRATNVKINLTFSSQEIVAEISDNGCGFDPQTRQTGMGLRTIRERIEALMGSVQLESAPESGTRLTLHAPLKSQS